jgi:hypothetical protein
MSTGQQWLFAPAQPLVDRLGKQFFRKIPARPGVYRMHGATGNVLYVGKARTSGSGCAAIVRQGSNHDIVLSAKENQHRDRPCHASGASGIPGPFTP